MMSCCWNHCGCKRRFLCACFITKIFFTNTAVPVFCISCFCTGSCFSVCLIQLMPGGRNHCVCKRRFLCACFITKIFFANTAIPVFRFSWFYTGGFLSFCMQHIVMPTVYLKPNSYVSYIFSDSMDCHFCCTNILIIFINHSIISILSQNFTITNNFHLWPDGISCICICIWFHWGRCLWKEYFSYYIYQITVIRNQWINKCLGCIFSGRWKCILFSSFFPKCIMIESFTVPSCQKIGRTNAA